MPTRFEQLSARMIKDLMRDFGFKDFQAAGFPGNGYAESGGFTKAFEQSPTVAGSKGGIGFWQATGMTLKNPRRKNFEALMVSMGLNPKSATDALRYDVNYKFLVDELKSTEKAVVAAVKRTTSAAQAAEVVMEKYERPGTPHLPVRQRGAQIALEAYKRDVPWNTDEALKKADTPVKGDIPAATTTVGVPVIVGGGLYAWLKGLSFSEWGFGALIFGVILVALYWFVIRPILLRFDELKPMFAHFDSKALTWVDRLQLTLKGMKSYLWGRLMAISGAAAALLQGTGFIDVSTFLPNLTYDPLKLDIPATMYVPGLLLPTLAWVNNKLASTRETTPEDLAKELTGADSSLNTLAEQPAPVPSLTQTKKKKKRKSR